MNNDNLRERIYLAALLHDVGKFYQRADEGNVSSSKLLNAYVKNLESVYCPLSKDHNRSHKHVLWTAQFLEDFRPVFVKLNKNSEWTDSRLTDSLLELSVGHHLSPDQLTEAGRIIRKADHLSSGMDRSTDEAMRDDQDETGWNSFKRKRMTSIMEGLNLEQNEGKTGKDHYYHLPVKALSLESSFFPSETFNEPPDYAALWNNFIAEFKFIQSDNVKAFSETFLYLLQKYTCTIPSSTVNFPDVSLYDHLKTTAAIAVCLHDWHNHEKAGLETFLMIGGDFSGIQSYIYNIVSENAGKNLKGRSFYLKLLSDSIVNYILEQLNLFEANIIYNSGGSFFILAPNTLIIRNKLYEALNLIEDQIFKTHGTSLYVAIDAVPLSTDALMGLNGKSIGETWKELFESRDNKKRTRYSKRLINDYETFFNPGESGGITPRDVITGEEIAPEKVNTAMTLDGQSIMSNEEENIISELTWKQIRLGRELKKSELWVISKGPLSYWNEKESINPANLGFYYYFLSKKDILAKQDLLKASADRVKIITINGNQHDECDFLNTAIQGTNNIYGFDFLGGNKYPTDDDGSPKSFDELTGKTGFRRLGILRMDVDNLGKVFQKGFSGNRNTFSRYAALSRSLDWFFKGYLNTLWKENFQEYTYILYSGGDDLFIVGRWDKTIEFAEKIREEFKKFVCKNPVLSLSGGVAIVTPKFPIKRGAQESEIAENKAKNYYFNGKSKNAFTILDKSLHWDIEYPLIKELKIEIIKLLKNEDLPKSFISKLFSHFENSGLSKTNLISPKTYWLLAYDFARFAERTRNREAKEIIHRCKTDVYVNTLNGSKVSTPYHVFELWLLAARWAEIELRTLKN